jgi:hypothetical protein
VARAKSVKKEKQAENVKGLADVATKLAAIVPVEPAKDELADDEPVVEPAAKIKPAYDSGKPLVQLKSIEDNYSSEELPKKLKRLDAAFKKLPKDVSTSDFLTAAFKAWNGGATSGLQW